MASSIIAPFLIALLAPAPAETASAAPPEPDPALTEAATDGEPEPEPGPEAAEPTAAEPTAPTPAPTPSPFDMPPPTAVAAFPKPTPAPPPPPRPIRWRLDFGVNVGSTIVSDPGLRAFAERRNLLETGVSTLFDFRLAEGRFFVGGGVAYQHVGRQGDAHGQVNTDLQLHEPQVLGRATFMVVEGVDVFARAGVGPSFVRASYDSDGFESTRQRDVLPRVDGRAGLLLYLPKAWLPRKQASRVSAGLELGLGYAWRGKLEVRPVLQQDSDPLRATTARWGELSLHGLCWGVGAFLRVM
jgi:hypothetical protein